MDINYTFIDTRIHSTPGHSSFYEIDDWLESYEGKGHYAYGGYGVYFENEEDALVFALRWA
jgi:hypothetical protein